MVLIISSDTDISTNHIIEWFLYQKTPFIRINDSTKVFLKELELDDNTVDACLILKDFFHNNFEFKLSSITSVWYRRGYINIATNRFLSKYLNSKKHKKIYEYLNKEKKQVEELLYHMLAEKRHINTYFDDVEINKSYVLWKASLCGLKIPKNSITSYPEVIKTKLNSWDNMMITKALKYSFITIDKKMFSAGTEKITEEYLEDSPRFIFPTLVQNQIDKAFEVRTFYLEGQFYSVAIFSQSNEQTAVDFRNYNYEKPNRTPPFQLPRNIEEKLASLMKLLGYNSGSIDIVVNKKGEFIFLEVNPVGQFHQVSIPGNYYLEEKIAKYLH
jgi:ATP-GRASP peptide maturase of grasp-with-spasm system